MPPPSLLLLLAAICGLAAAPSTQRPPHHLLGHVDSDGGSSRPKHVVTINGGHFEVDNEPFFPVGFYYLWDNKLSFTMPPVRTTPATPARRKRAARRTTAAVVTANGRA
eukprot:COSAG04_NODE_1092_length_8322_cov_1.935547_8_plen_109_part_00